MSRIAGLVMASALTTAALVGAAGLIARDFLGEERMLSLMSMMTASMEPIVAADEEKFEPGKEITFFETVPVPDSVLEVWTGAAYTSVPAVRKRAPSKQWCYINVSSGKPGLVGRIDLGIQEGNNPPNYASALDLAAVNIPTQGLSPDVAAALAKSHCRFGLIDPLAKKS